MFVYLDISVEILVKKNGRLLEIMHIRRAELLIKVVKLSLKVGIYLSYDVFKTKLLVLLYA